jgi:hypothetical protein
LAAAKFKPLVFYASGFSFSDAATICICVILYGLWLFPARFPYVIINMPHMKSLVQLADLCAPWELTSGAVNLLLQTLQFQEGKRYIYPCA